MVGEVGLTVILDAVTPVLQVYVPTNPPPADAFNVVLPPEQMVDEGLTVIVGVGSETIVTLSTIVSAQCLPPFKIATQEYVPEQVTVAVWLLAVPALTQGPIQ